MTTALTPETAHEELLRDALGRGSHRLTEVDALLWMALFHTHRIEFRPGTIQGMQNGDAAGGGALAAVTQRHAASIVASCWPESNDPRADYTYWYYEYNSRTPYEVLGDVPPQLLPRMQRLKEILLEDERVAAVVEED